MQSNNITVYKWKILSAYQWCMTGYAPNPSEVAIADDWQEQYKSNIGVKNHDKN